MVRPDQRRKLLDLKERLGREHCLPDVVMMRYAAAFRRDGSLAAAFFRERLIRRGPGAVWKGRVHETVCPFGIIWKEDIWIEHRKMREEVGPMEQYYYEMERAFARRCREAALEDRKLLTQPGNERFVNGRYLW